MSGLLNLVLAITDAEVRLRLARQDEDSLLRGDMIRVHDDITPSLLIHQGLQIEAQQFALAQEVEKLGLHATDLQKAKVLERSNSLKRKFDAWITIQHLYLPFVALLRSRDDSSSTSPVAVQDLKLFLPSQVTFPRDATGVIHFMRYEWDFRYAQAQETLNDLRGLLLLHSHMLKSRDRYVRGQHQLTRSTKLLARVDEKLKMTATKYRRIRSALDNLSSAVLVVDWQNELRPLTDNDITGLTCMDDSRSEGRKKLSWIWKVHGTGADADTSTEAGEIFYLQTSIPITLRI